MEFIIGFFDLCVSSKKIGSKKIEKTSSFFQKIGKVINPLRLAIRYGK